MCKNILISRILVLFGRALHNGAFWRVIGKAGSPCSRPLEENIKYLTSF